MKILFRLLFIWFLTLGVFCFLLLNGCSFYTVSHDERPDAAGNTHYHTRVFSVVPPGGKELSKGSADINAQNSKNNKWQIKIGADTQTDLTGTAVMMQGMLAQIAELAGQLALAKTMVHPVPETGPPTPENIPMPQSVPPMPPQPPPIALVHPIAPGGTLNR